MRRAITQPAQRGGIDTVGLGALQHRLGEVMGRSWIDDRHRYVQPETKATAASR